MSSLFKIWGVTPSEIERPYPCDDFIKDADDAIFRGITIYAGPQTIYKWLCQMRIAPYSYDWIDNLGRKSPEKLTPSLDDLKIGQTVMTIFKLIDFKANSYLTIRIKEKIIGHQIAADAVITYLIHQKNQSECRLLVKLLVQYPKGFFGLLNRLILPLGDLIMMRQQLLNFKRLSENMDTV
ncbi:MAG: hypothetical protein ACKVE4_02480 [Dissulfuribacterales bacterium]